MVFLVGVVPNDTAVVIGAMILLGLSYSLCASSLWPCIALLVAEERVGTAYGIVIYFLKEC